MSGFDKEAERERLREKYERDQEERAATQRMSELLLQGATMTNSHCDDCGDPIFRYDGQEFCPTCQADGEAEAEAADAGADEQSTDGTTPAATDTAPSDEPSVVEAEAGTGDDQPAPASEATMRSRRASPSAAASSQESPGDGQVRDLVGEGRAADAPADSQPAGGDGTIDEARASLTRTLVRYARAAEETDDPRRATELLGAAREAAEALSALDRF